MYEAICDLVDLLTHKNLDFLAAVCHLIVVIATFDENSKIMVDAGIVENLAKLVSTVNLHFNSGAVRYNTYKNIISTYT